MSLNPIRPSHPFIEKLLTPKPKPEHLKDPIKALRAKLNEDFSENAKIKHVIFWLLYIPHPLLPGAHAEVQVNQERISVGNNINRVHDVNPRTRKYDKGCPYLAIGLIVSPGALWKIEKAFNTHSLQGLDCSDVSVRYIEQGISNFIPYPIRLSPVFSTLYLLIKSVFESKNKTVDTVEARSKNRSFRDLLSIAPIGESLVIFGVTQLIKAVFNPSKTSS